MGKCGENGLTKKRTFTKNISYDWYDWLINNIPEPNNKIVGSVKDQIMSLFKTKDYSKLNNVKNVYLSGKKPNKLKIQTEYEGDNITKNIRIIFKLNKKNKAIKDI